MSHFQRKEYACKCGCGFDTVDFDLLRLCNEVREFEGDAVIVSSGCRCLDHNNKIGGVLGSQHTLGRAADLHVSDPWKTHQYLCRQYPNQYGFGVYDNFVHVDTRTNGPVRWDKRSKK
jgi:uncharacterized protein YcbK (DUF882 family)